MRAHTGYSKPMVDGAMRYGETKMTSTYGLRRHHATLGRWQWVTETPEHLGGIARHWHGERV